MQANGRCLIFHHFPHLTPTLTSPVLSVLRITYLCDYGWVAAAVVLPVPNSALLAEGGRERVAIREDGDGSDGL